MGSIMIEENVVSAAGTTHRAGVDDFLHTIRNAGFRPSPARHAVPDRARLPARRRVVKASVSRRMPSAAPQDVWE